MRHIRQLIMGITKQQILTHTTESQIYKHYCSHYKESLLEGNRNVKSVFNPSESNPSLSFYRSGDSILFKCFSTGYQGDCFQFVSDLKGFDNKRDFAKVLEAIAQDLRLNVERQKVRENKDYKAEYYSSFTKAALAFWETFKVHESILSKYRVRQLRLLTYKRSKFDYDKDAILAFEFDINGRKKVYVPDQPKVDKKYYIKTQNSSDIFGLSQLSSFKSTYILICEGEKDCLVAASAGIPAISFQSANTLPTKAQIRELFKHSAYLIVCYDNDDGGIKGALKLCDRYDLIRYQLDEDYNDLADYLPQADSKDFKKLLFDKIVEWRHDKNIAVWEEDNQYWKSDRHGNKIQVSNFIVELDAMILGKETPERLIRLVSNHYVTTTLSAPVKIFSSEQSFSNFVECQKGNFLFHGTKNDLQEIKRKVFHLSDYLDEAVNLGWDRKKEIFVLSNGVISNGQFYRPNHLGVWEDLYIPTSVDHYDVKPGDNSHIEYVTGKAIDGHRIDLNEFCDFVLSSFSENTAIVSLAYLLSSSVFDFISNRFRAFPILNIEGQRGTGKGSLIKMLMTIFTKEVQEVSLQNATRNFITRKMEQLPNIPIWFDEFSNGLHDQIIQTLKNFYDLIGRSKAQYTGGNETSRSKILSPAIITGEEAPKHNEALFSRLIVLSLPPLRKSLEETNKFMRRMMDLQNGVSHLLAEIYSYRELIIADYDENYNELLEYFYQATTEFKINADTRIIKNYASIFAPLLILSKHKKVEFEPIRIKVRASSAMCDHQMSQVKYDEVNIFLEHIISMCELPISNVVAIQEDYDYIIEDEIYYLKKSAFAKWGKYYRDLTGRIGKDPTAIETYIKHKDYGIGDKRKYFKTDNFNKKQQRCVALDLKKAPEFFTNYFNNSKSIEL